MWCTSSFNHNIRNSVNLSRYGIIRLLCLQTMAAYCSTAKAQNTTENPTARESVLGGELDEVTVTASKTGTPINQASKLVTVITKDEIAKAPAKSIQDLLVYVANVDVIQRGGHGVQADISIRGGSFDENAILIDGINFSNSQTGHYSFDLPINLSDIERIEIIHAIFFIVILFILQRLPSQLLGLLMISQRVCQYG